MSTRRGLFNTLNINGGVPTIKLVFSTLKKYTDLKLFCKPLVLYIYKITCLKISYLQDMYIVLTLTFV